MKTSTPAGFYRGLLRVAERRHPEGLFRIGGLRERVVALTIDDGPSSRTEEILGILEEFGARASFFIHTDRIGPETGGPEIIGRLVEAGHDVANHMPDHRVSVRLGAEEFGAEFERAHECLREMGVEPRLFRAAGGAYHTERMLPSLRRFNYLERFIMASYLPWDTHFPFPIRYAKHLVAGAFPGAIYVLHDGDDASGRLGRTIETLRYLLEHLRGAGYRAEPLSALIPEGEPVSGR